MHWADWGFRESPFETEPLQAADDSIGLLVGRELDLNLVVNKISTDRRVVVIEGIPGIGKTSFANVVAQSMYLNHCSTFEGPLFLPCRSSFELEEETNAGAFVEVVLLEVAQTLIEKQDELRRSADFPATEQLRRLLNSQEVDSLRMGIQHFKGIHSQTESAGYGYERTAFRLSLEQTLMDVFDDNGGVICLLDNLELLETSAIARRLLERLRDKLRVIHHVRWIMCGSQGITFGVASSPRLSGWLQSPMLLEEIERSYVRDLLDKRIEHFRVLDNKAPYLPITTEDFEGMYLLLRGNARETLAEVADYCAKLQSENKMPVGGERRLAFKAWLEARASASYEAVKPTLEKHRIMNQFRAILEGGGECTTEEHNALGFADNQHFLTAMNELFILGLLNYAPDLYSETRQVIQVSPKSWILSYYIYEMANPDKINVAFRTPWRTN